MWQTWIYHSCHSLSEFQSGVVPSNSNQSCHVSSTPALRGLGVSRDTVLLLSGVQHFSALPRSGTKNCTQAGVLPILELCAGQHLPSLLPHGCSGARVLAAVASAGLTGPSRSLLAPGPTYALCWAPAVPGGPGSPGARRCSKAAPRSRYSPAGSRRPLRACGARRRARGAGPGLVAVAQPGGGHRGQRAAPGEPRGPLRTAAALGVPGLRVAVATRRARPGSSPKLCGRIKN